MSRGGPATVSRLSSTLIRVNQRSRFRESVLSTLIDNPVCQRCANHLWYACQTVSAGAALTGSDKNSRSRDI